MERSRKIRKTLAVLFRPLSYGFVLLLLSVTLAGLVFAQTNENAKTDQRIPGFVLPQPVEATALDQPVNPAEYIVGPGDKLSIFIWGNIQAQYSLT